MKTILDFSKKELESIVKPSFRAKQIYEWIYKKGAVEFTQMSNIPAAMRAELTKSYTIDSVREIKCEISSDGSKKYLFALHDGKTIESVLLPMK